MIPTAESIIDLLIPYKKDVSEEENLDSREQNITVIKAWCNLHREAALKAASEKAKVEWEPVERPQDRIDKESILSAYPLTNIK